MIKEQIHWTNSLPIGRISLPLVALCHATREISHRPPSRTYPHLPTSGRRACRTHPPGLQGLGPEDLTPDRQTGEILTGRNDVPMAAPSRRQAPGLPLQEHRPLKPPKLLPQPHCESLFFAHFAQWRDTVSFNNCTGGASLIFPSNFLHLR